jgi:hypothetical protein
MPSPVDDQYTVLNEFAGAIAWVVNTTPIKLTVQQKDQ